MVNIFRFDHADCYLHISFEKIIFANSCSYTVRKCFKITINLIIYSLLHLINDELR